jgi:TetR/AcrR family transcriptional regulator
MQRSMNSKPPAPGRKKTSEPRQKRSRGRPKVRGAVGRDAIIAAASQLLVKLPPHQVPNVVIARKAGVDPALVRYYFGNREELLIAVVENLIAAWTATHLPPDAPPAERLSVHIADMLDFSGRVRSMQRLMIDGCAQAKSPSVRARARELNSAAVRNYAQYLRPGEDEVESATDPLFMFVAIIGMCEFFAAAQPMILPLVPGHLDAEELARRYETFIRKLVLDGLRSRLKAPKKFKADA